MHGQQNVRKYRVNLQNNKQTALCCISLDIYIIESYSSFLHITLVIELPTFSNAGP